MTTLLFDKAKIAFVRGMFAEAVAAFTEVLDEDPRHALALYSRGTARVNMEDFEGAIADFDAYIALDEDNEKVFTARGTAQLGRGKNEEALEDFNRAIELNEFYPSAYFGRAEAFTRLGEEEQARLDIDVGTRIARQLAQSRMEGTGTVFEDATPGGG